MKNAAEAGLARLVDRYGLDTDASNQLSALLRVVVDDRYSPTAVREPERVVDDHLADSLVALEVEAVREARNIADLGSGAGFPGLPLAIALPASTVVVAESNARKCTFLCRAVETTDLQNAIVVNTRVEAWPDGHDRFEVVTARALASLPVVAEYAAPLLRRGGMLVAWRGQREREAEQQAARAATELGLEVLEPVGVRPYPAATSRHLHLMVKVDATPARFPRRPGVALKRPLGR
jgi:16S rRNA (guanine527-N7)-methyltransferase